MRLISFDIGIRNMAYCIFDTDPPPPTAPTISEWTVLNVGEVPTANTPARNPSAATNPCPCGWHGHSSQRCICLPSRRDRYWARLSGPLLDRLDLQVVVQPVAAEQLRQNYRPSPTDAGSSGCESTAVVAARVREARQRMHHRNPDGHSNGGLGVAAFGRCVQIDDAALRLWEHAITARRLSGRSGDRVLRVAQTIVDLDGQRQINESAIAEALSYRSFDQLS